MNKKRNGKRSFLLLISLISILIACIFISVAAAKDDQVISDECENIKPGEYDKQVICELETYILSANKVIQDNTNNMMEEVIKSTSFEISIDEKVKNAHYLIFAIAGAVMVLFLVLTGHMYIVSAANPEKREKAKRQLKNIMIILIIAGALMPIISVINDLGNTTNVMFAQTYKIDEDFFTNVTFESEVTDPGTYSGNLEKFGYMISYSPPFIKAARWYLMSMEARNVILIFLIVIAPFILIMFYFEPMKEFGKVFAYLFLIELFLPAIFMLVLHFTSGNLNEFARMNRITAALYFCVAIHAILVLVAILKAGVSAIQDMKERVAIQSK
ncbi:hypothetical protein DRJ17_05000 [Candidatus Woesearchaeota archaeon]|nr:MAG: hypothetical protein DRJ17_05000 [Candidatus Woesearchaeota archaeon]